MGENNPAKDDPPERSAFMSKMHELGKSDLAGADCDMPCAVASHAFNRAPGRKVWIFVNTMPY
ncbi:hypothetical protein K2X14_14970 [Acetobacter sp. TBRC 12305]|uniref:Uncharacterized protein n=1 Tax=Acetobacter garciniae TaxID=2817435 RepID=A0A939KR52_9PROT|nr:hypothetical protein [Acetobacter garciniae]MBO1326409.1 hypothetical protein [Acetobacter garciniae]MBX0346136.1 hypothetical protein [Acetobacter garciniae]